MARGLRAVRGMKATTLLERQHRKVITILKKLEGGRERNKRELVQELCANMAGHMAIEQELFYPVLREVDEELAFEALEEHALAEFELKRVLHTDPEDDSFAPRVAALRELFENHVQEEEQEMFPKVDEEIEEDRLDELGDEMKARFDEVLERGPDSVIPSSLGETSADRALAEMGGSVPTPRGSGRSTSRGRAPRRRVGRASARPRRQDQGSRRPR